MIIEAILNLLKTFLLFIIGLFPSIPSLSGLISSVDPFVSALSWLNLFIDLGVFSVCIIALFIFANIDLIWGAIMWVVRKIPGVS